MIHHTTRGFLRRMSRDHFVVLPSNSCAKVHPENTAGKFNVSWENPLELDGQGWRVALIEMNYNYSPKTINTTFGVEYSKLTSHTITTGNFTFVWPDAKSSPYLEGDALKDYPPTRPPFDIWKLPKFSIDRDGKIMAECQFRFTISFSGVKYAAKMGFKKLPAESFYDNDRKRWTVVASDKPTISETIGEPLIKVEHLVFDLTSQVYIVHRSFSFSKAIYWTKCEDLGQYVSSNLQQIFTLFQYEDGRIQFKIRDDVSRIKLLNGFNFVLGFVKQDFDNSDGTNPTWTAEHPPQLHRGISRLYIYASCCAPIRVGDVLVPLLRSVFVNDDDDEKKKSDTFGKAKNYIVKQPMYVPVSNTAINTIEINIRDDSGRIIPFDEGSITSLTLHFRNDG